MYRFGTWLIALALVFNGAAMIAWNGAPMAAGAIAQLQHAQIQPADDDAMQCDANRGAAAVVARHSGQTHGPAHDHLKCCGTCTVASVLPAVAAIPVAFSYRGAVFHVTQPHLVGHLVALDPDIPKSIV